VITGTSNQKIKFAQSLARKKERAAANKFLLEGARLISEAVRAGLVPALVFYERSAMQSDARVRALVAAWEHDRREIHEVSAPVMRALSDTETPPGIAAVFPIPALAAPPEPQLLLILDRLRDPGNVGTIFRTAWAAGVDSVLLAPGTADPHNPKIVRAAMGAHFHVPLTVATWDEIAERIKHFPRVYLSDASGEIPYNRADWTPPLALIVGGEAEGASAQARQLATQTLSIPMPGAADSLNAAIAAGILLFEAVRVPTPNP
jgi:TrmH family RNA methyltransferase